ncbi:MAG: di-trans,poly-cis-decaprenylcistransferase [Oscillospiraceae bacterium]|nr:di-trans,poly-cis-decaprenylcistransferase [Oscillospiraceae bacterium]
MARRILSGLFGLLKKETTQAGRPDMTRLPRHIAIILDGNGRWAKKRGLPRRSGHAVGADTFRTIATYCRDLGVRYLTVYAFSTENWKRPVQEVEAIMKLLGDFLDEAARDVDKNRVFVHVMGDLSVLSDELREKIRRTEEITGRYAGSQVNVCVNYGGRHEICQAVERFMCEHPGHTGPVSEEELASCLYTAGMPDPDLLIRPGGEYRLSNYLIWQTAYTELYFTDVLWPDFTERDLDAAILAYQKRDRRFGDVR